VLFARYLWSTGVVRELRKSLATHRFSGDYTAGSLALLILFFLVAGGRRPAQLSYFAHDGLLKRLAWLREMPSHTTLSRFLTGFRAVTLAVLVTLNRQFVASHLRRVGLTSALTLDLDGTVVSTRGHAERARKGYNPTRKGARSYRPLTLHVAETGQFYAVKNRPGNAADNDGSVSFMGEQICALRREFPGARLVLRQDSAFFADNLLSLYEGLGVGYLCVAKLYEDLALVIKARRRWARVRDGVEAFEFSFKMGKWTKHRYFVAYRFRLSAREIAERRGEQLDLFLPADAGFRYMLFVTNLSREECDTCAVHAFYGGRGGQEKDLGELKSEFAFDVLPSRRYAANSAWQQLSVLAYNTTVGFATEIVGGAERTAKDEVGLAKATRLFHQLRAKTLRFLHLNVPGVLTNDSGRLTLHLPESRARCADWEVFQKRLERYKIAA